MRAPITQLLVLLSALSLAACASVSPHLALVDKARDNIASTEIVAPIAQSEIYIIVPPAGAPGGGILGAVVGTAIDSARTSSAETAVRPLRDAVVDFNFDEALQSDLKASLSQVTWLHVAGARVLKEATIERANGAVTESQSAAVILVKVDYHLSNDGGSLFMSARALLYPNTAALRALRPKDAKADVPANFSNALYYNSFVFKAKAPGASSNRPANMTAWSANKGEPLRAGLRLGAAKLAQLIAGDLQGLEEVPAPTAGAPAKTIKVDAIEGQIVSRESEGVVVRFRDATMAYVAQSAVEP